MGNSSSKDKPPSRPDSTRRMSGHTQAAHGHASSAHPPPPPPERLVAQMYSSRAGRGSRPDLPFLNLGRDRDREGAAPAPDRPKETKQEKEARRAERDRQARLAERERSMREESVDGGFLVTLGTYTGPEDFNKAIVRQLQIERRLAPFWKGLNDHSDSWTEAQLVAAARGLPIPAADEVPPEMARTGSQASSNPGTADANINKLTVPISSRSQSYESSASANLSASHPAFSSSGPASTSSPTSSTAQIFRGRAKTLASLATGSKSQSPDLTPQEVRLPKDPNVNGQPLEAYLYKDASECPICFMYYPPYLNHTRCCDQPICSECFVQIKRPDPHPPEHEQPGEQRPPEEEAETLVSEVAACPFCVTPEFGISYEPPPFRRGLAYANQGNPLKNPTSAMSSSSSLGSGARRRATSLSANAPQVITTDRVRPDWAKKLNDARAHALRRSAAATALHNAAYFMGNQGEGQFRGGLAGFSRRRRTLFGDSAGPGGAGSPRSPEGMLLSPYGHIIRAANRNEAGGDDANSSGDLFPARGSSRRTRVDDLEDLMMMEAIRLSLAAEEDRKKREEKDAKKDAKKKAKEERKEAKQAEKMAKKGGGAASGAAPPMYRAGTNESTSTWASTSMARSTSNLGQFSIPEEEVPGKGKAPAQDFAGFNALSEPTSTLNTEMKSSQTENGAPSPTSSGSPPQFEDPQKHLEESRARVQPTHIPPPTQHLRELSNTSSVASSFVDASPGLDPTDLSSQDQSTTTAAGGHEPMLNFRSLTAMVSDQDKDRGSEHVERSENPPHLSHPSHLDNLDTSGPTGRSRGDSGESSHSAPPPVYDATNEHDQDRIMPAPVRDEVDSKDIGKIDVGDLELGGRREGVTQ